MKALVSGGTGLVGRYIVETLLGAGYSIVVAGRSQPAEDMFSPPVMFRPLDLASGQDPGPLFDDADFFIHAAFDHLPGFYRNGEGDDPQTFRRRNLDGTVRLFQAAKQAGVRCAIFLSSRAVYDDVPSGTALTEALDLKPSSLYGEIKLLGEQALATLNGPGFCTASLRLTGVYGDLRPNKWDELFADYLTSRQVPTRAGSEVHGRDVGQAVRLMLELEPALVGGQSFNVSDIVADTHQILSSFGRGIRDAPALPPPADKARVTEMDTRKIYELGWRPGGMPLLQETLRQLAAAVF